MKDTNDIFESLSGIFFKNLIDGLDGKNNAAVTRFILAATAMLMFVGTEAVKLVFRNNFGSKGVSIVRAVLCFLAFGAISAASIAASLYPQQGFEIIGHPISFFVMGLFYAVLAFYVLIKAIVQKARSKDQVHPQYRGDSTLLSSLMKSGWSQARVQNLAEPLLTLGIGVFLTAFNLLWGIPLAFCAVSVWLHQLLEAIYGISHVRDALAEKGYNTAQEGAFTEVKH